MSKTKEIQDFEKFIEEYDGEDGFPKTTSEEDYAGGSRVYIQTDIVEAFLKQLAKAD